MLYAAFRITDPTIAEQIRQQKLVSSYENGFWDNDSAYYSQNLSWFGLFPPDAVPSDWLTP
jgi:endoglucanase